MKQKLPRRRFVKLTAASVAGLLAGCGEDTAATGAGTPDQGAAAGTVDALSHDPGVAADPGTADRDTFPPWPDQGTPPPDTAPPPPEIYAPRDTLPNERIFPLGLQAGDATAAGAVLWTHFVGTGDLRVVVFADGDAESEGEVVAAREIADAGASFVHVDVDGLEPDTPYRYTFETLSRQSGVGFVRTPLGHFRTAPADGAARPVVFGATCCLATRAFTPEVLGRAATDPLDFFLLLGDTVYADGSESLDDYRAHWNETLSFADFQALLRSTSTVRTWDDHEVDNNWDPETIDPEHLAAARGAFFEHSPIRRHPDQPDRIWRSLRWGRTVELFVLDCRGERRPSTRHNPDATYVSDEQLRWLLDGLRGSQATFKVVINSVPIGDILPPLVDLLSRDRWTAYGAQRDRVLEAIDDIDGVVFLSGDFHFGAIARLAAPGDRYGDLYEVLCGPGAQVGNPLGYGGEGLGPKAPLFDFTTADNNYVRFTASALASPPTLRVEFIDQRGAVQHDQTLEFPPR